MPSPFPGMNPYLERAVVWTGFHTRYITALATAVGRLVEPNYYVEVEEQLYLHELPDGPRSRLGDPDVSVHPTGRAGGPLAAVGQVTAPGFVYAPPEAERVHFLTIRSRDGDATVTVLELLSRSNKYAGSDRDQYLLKWGQLVQSRDTNFVELDLLRGGPRMPWAGLPDCDYCAIVHRPAAHPRADLWALRLRAPLPSIPIPLRPGEVEPTVDLQAVLHEVYDAGRYELRLYRGEPEPRLSAEDAAWARGLLPPAG